MHGSVVLAPGRHAPDIEVLFAQARRRRRRRRLLGAAVSLVLVGAVIFGATVGSGGHGAAVRGGDGRQPPVAAKSQSSKLALPAVRLAYVDNGNLVIGDPATGALHVGPAVDASSSGPLILAAGQLYWADARTDGAPVRDYDLATGKMRYLPRGEAVFTSAGGRNLYIARNSRTLLEMAADGSGRAVVLRRPAGWFMYATRGRLGTDGGGRRRGRFFQRQPELRLRRPPRKASGIRRPGKCGSSVWASRSSASTPHPERATA